MDDGLDIIGDVHGQHAKLVALLAAMGYEHEDGVWRHPTRTAVFVGDLVDRGPEQLAVLSTVRQMVDHAGARIVAGNHEYNALCYATPDPDRPFAHLRPHNQKKRHQHAAFLAEVAFDSPLHHEILGWFRTMPMWLDLGGIRVVHACWAPASMAALGAGPADVYTLGDLPLVATARTGTDEWLAVEHLLKGPEIPIDPQYLDPNGSPRSNARYRWWRADAASSMATAAVLPGDTRTVDGQPYPALGETPIEAPVAPYADEVPVCFGHYWETGTPAPLTPYTACVDYSAGTSGPLVAYRWSGESELTVDNFTSSAPTTG